MPVKTLKDFLDSHKIKYISISHSPAFTSQEIAAAAHISGKQLAKTVIAKVDGGLAMIVVPAHEHVNFSAFKQLAGVASADLASESEFKNRFPECEVGAMPPFGNLYELPVYVAGALSMQEQLTFNAGSHSELVQVAYRDFSRWVNPKVL